MLPPYAEKTKKRVRDFFKQGHKSSNKNYHNINKVGEEKAEKRRVNSVHSLVHIGKLPNEDNPYTFAENITKMPDHHHSGNCKHMTALAGYYLIKYELIDPDLIYIGQLGKPGDHIFCLVSTEYMDEQMEFPSVLDFANAELAPSWIIVDPWLNVACRANEYVTKVDEKLNKWTADGKRILWDGGKNDIPSWYVPSGEYREALVNAPLQLFMY